MRTREMASEDRLAHWSRVMSERRESGLSIKAFCLASGIHPNVFYYWHRKLREAACRQIAEIQASESQEPTEPRFTEVLLAPAPARAAVSRQPTLEKLPIKIGKCKRLILGMA